jgi:hypothetical protein
LEVVERGEFLLGDDAGALECDALSALDGYLDALREESGVMDGGGRRQIGARCRGRGIWSR